MRQLTPAVVQRATSPADALLGSPSPRLSGRRVRGRGAGPTLGRRQRAACAGRITAIRWSARAPAGQRQSRRRSSHRRSDVVLVQAASRSGVQTSWGAPPSDQPQPATGPVGRRPAGLSAGSASSSGLHTRRQAARFGSPGPPVLLTSSATGFSRVTDSPSFSLSAGRANPSVGTPAGDGRAMLAPPRARVRRGSPIPEHASQPGCPAAPATQRPAGGGAGRVTRAPARGDADAPVSAVAPDWLDTRRRRRHRQDAAPRSATA